MHNPTTKLPRVLLIVLSLTLSVSARSQSGCTIFTEYKNILKIWAASSIDSLKRQGIDTVLFYGVGTPETGWLEYGKILWRQKGVVYTLEIRTAWYQNASHLTTPKFRSHQSYEPIQFYADNRLDTVTTLPKELRWMSHDFLHYVYSTISGTEVCFTAEEYLVRGDYEHLRSRWIRILSDYVYPYDLIR